MSLITSPLPRTVDVGRRQCPINTDFRASIRFELLTLSDKLAPEDIPAILVSGNRTLAGPTVPPGGLYMTRLWYDEDI